MLAVSRCEWQQFLVHRRMLHMTRTVSSRFVSLSVFLLLYINHQCWSSFMKKNYLI